MEREMAHESREEFRRKFRDGMEARRGGLPLSVEKVLENDLVMPEVIARRDRERAEEFLRGARAVQETNAVTREFFRRKYGGTAYIDSPVKVLV